jgi:hypothetical protein
MDFQVGVFTRVLVVYCVLIENHHHHLELCMVREVPGSAFQLLRGRPKSIPFQL